MPSLLRLVFLSIFRVLMSQTQVHKQGTRRRVSLYIRHGLLWQRLSLNWPCNWGWPWTLDLPASTYWVLGLLCAPPCPVSIVLGIKFSAPCVLGNTLPTEPHPQAEESDLVTLEEAALCRGSQYMQMINTLMHTATVGGAMVPERLLRLHQTDHSLDPFYVCLTQTTSDHITGTYLIRSS